MSIMGFLFFFNAEKYVKKEILNNLNAIADLKVGRLETYFGERKDDSRVLESLRIIKLFMPTLEQYKADPKNSNYLEAKQSLDKQLSLFLSAYASYSGIMLLDKDGIVVYCTDPNHSFAQLNKPFIINGENIFTKSKQITYVSDIYKNPNTKNYNMLIAGPLYDFQNQFIGVAVLEIDMDIIYKFIQDTTGLGTSGETLLLKDLGTDKIIYLNRLRHDNASPLSKIISRGSKFGMPAQRAIKRENGSGTELDYRNQKVLAAWRYIPSLGWGLVAKIDIDETFEPVQHLKKIMFVIFVISFLMTIAIVILSIRTITNPIQELRKCTEMIGRGNLAYKCNIRGQDELVDLAQAFNKMGSDLQKTTTSIEELNKEIAQRKKAEQDLKEAMNIKSEFTSMVSHELRTPLMAIKEGISLVLEGLAGSINDKQKDLLDTAKRNTERLSRLINNILDFQKLEAGKMVLNFQENDINDAVNESYKIMVLAANQKGLKTQLDLEKNLPKAMFDKDSIIQVITNLVNNAVKYCDKGSIIIKTRKERNNIHVSVSDTGYGIEKEDMSKLFQSFERFNKETKNNNQGSGLGLAICYALIELHNGNIWAESEYGIGSTFHFTLPITKP